MTARLVQRRTASGMPLLCNDPHLLLGLPALWYPVALTMPAHRAIGVVEVERIDVLNALRAKFVDEGVFVRPFGSAIYLTPAFTIAPDELRKLTGAVVKLVQR